MQCPNCGSYDVWSTGKTGIVIFMVGIASILPSLIIPFIGVFVSVLSALFGVLGLLMVITSPFMDDTNYTCNNCKNKFKESDVNGK